MLSTKFFQPGKCVHKYFEEIALQKPQATALVFNKIKFTYRELNSRANQLAAYLISKGVKPDSIVGLQTDRSSEMIIGILGILKAGAAYLPLDPKHPSERLKLIIEDAKITLKLTLSKNKLNAEIDDVEDICLDTDWEQISVHTDENPNIKLTTDNLAYVIYTSGSTGKPKGVMIEHKSLLTLLNAFDTIAPLKENPACLSVTPFGFDVSVWEFFTSLLSGSCLHLLETELLINIKQFIDYIFENSISCAYFPPSVLQEITNEFESRNKKIPLKRLLLGVEPIRQNILQRLQNLSEEITIINAYGPTETTICATSYIFKKEAAPEKRTPIGKALPGYQVYLVDDKLNPVSQGETGQIVIGGNALARGYLNAPELTNKKFVKNIFSTKDGNRLYLTGDMARELPDGNIEFEGRKDFQLKIRGHRIELGEIEHIIEKHPQINEVAIITLTDKNNLKKLVAYFSSDEDKKPLDEKALREFMQARLPSYMIPSAFVKLNKLPRTPNEKIDRKALEKLEITISTHENYIAPENNIEKQLAEIWEETLEIPRISVTDDFFEIGGNSISAIIVISRIEEKLQITFPVSIFFENPNIRKFCENLENWLSKNIKKSKTGINRISREKKYHQLTFGQEELWILHELDSSKITYNILNRIEINGLLDINILKKTLIHIINRFESLRTVFLNHEGTPLQHILEDFNFDLPFSDISGDSSKMQAVRLEEIRLKLGRTVFNTGQLPLFKLELVKIEPHKHYLFLSILHIIFDGWSMGILLNEIKEIYSAICSNSKPRLAELKIQNIDFANWQREYFNKNLKQSQFEYWDNKMTPRPLPLNMVTNMPKNIDPSNGLRYWWHIPAETSKKLNQISKQMNSSLFVSLLSIFKILINKYSGQNDVVIGTPYANRSRHEIEPLIGYYTNMLPLRTKLRKDMSYREFAEEVRSSCFEAFSNADYPFGQLVKDLKIEKHQSRHPLYQVMFVMQNWQDPGTEFCELNISQKELGNNTSKVDLTLNVEEIDDKLECWLEYNTSMFSENDISQMAENFNKLIELCIADTEILVSELNLKGKPEHGSKLKKNFSCFIIGEGTLPLSCAEILLKNNCRIFGIISPDKSIKSWTTEREINFFEQGNKLYEILENFDFDYIFSIVNSTIFDNKTLKLPNNSTINYHDSLLPEYAGVYATNRAIIDRKKKHGISWHYAIEIIDGGDILIQKEIDISENDTALSLLAKCYEPAINGFEELVENLISGKVHAKKQDLKKRTYFSLYKRPEAGCTISWDRDAEDIKALVNALTYDETYPNEFAAPKVLIDNKFFIVRKVRLLDTSTEKPAGCILALDENSITISTNTRDISISGFLTIEGEEISVSELIKKHKLHKDILLQEIDKIKSGQLSKIYGQTCRYESFWVNRLSSTIKPELPYEKNSDKRQKPESRKEFIKLIIPQNIIDNFQNSAKDIELSEFLQTTFILYLSSLTQSGAFDIGISSYKNHDEIKNFNNFFSRYIPVRVNADYDADCISNITKLIDKIRETNNKKYFAREIYWRYPVLKKLADRNNWKNYLITLCRNKPENETSFLRLPSSCALNFVIPEQSKNAYLIFDTDIISTENAERIKKQFIIFTEGIIRQPHLALSGISLLSHEEKQLILEKWNNTQTGYPINFCIHELFEKQVGKTPNEIALLYKNIKLTYHELNARSNRLARFLQSKGVKRESLAGICLERSVEMIIGILGILKAGAAYLPIDPKYPKERKKLLLETSGVKLLLTSRGLADNLPESENLLIFDEHQKNEINKYPAENLTLESKPSDRAYIIFTSGSTGIPKGVQIEHSSLVSFTQNAINEYKIEKNDVMLQFASITFDAAVEEIFPALCSGAKLRLRTDEMLDTISGFINYCKEWNVSIADLPTAYWHQLVAETNRLNLKLPDKLRLVIIGGEMALTSSVELWRKQFGEYPELVNTYGPAETTVVATSYHFNESDDYEVMPIGKPISNTEVYILDRYLKPVPIGVPGELHIGGAGIARSYLGLPEKTNEKFISDPFTNKTKTRIYKTGDLAKFLPDSNIEFIGRIDNQVKIRGYRVELAEIEATLSKNEKIRECAIIVNKDIRGSKKLVAYYVLKTGVTADKTELYHFLKEILPYYMLPSSFVELDELPYTSSMKIDRKSLPVPEEISYHPASFAPPETKTEKQLAAIWQDVLNLKAISINESFFEIGGDSLLAIEAISKIREKIKVQIQLKNLFEFPSIKELADWIKKYNETKSKARNFFTKSKQIPINIINFLKNRKKPHSYLVSLQSQGTQIPFIMVYGDASVKYLPGFLGKDQPFYSFISQGTDGERIIYKRVEDIARLYLNELLTIFPEGTYRLCGHSFGGVVAYEMAQQLIAKGKDVSFLSLIDTATPKLDLLLIDKVSFRRKLLKFEYRVKRRLYSTFGLTIPYKYRNLYILDSFLKAQKYYKPALYTRDVFIFRSTKSRIKERDIGWRKYIKGKLTIIDIPGDHLTIIREPKTIKILAKEILACLRKSKQTKT